MKIKTGLAVLAIAVAATGCTVMTVTDEDLDRRTTRALGLTPDQFTITDRVTEGATTEFWVTTKAGEKYQCIVTGGTYSNSVMGSFLAPPTTASEALCTKMQQNGKAQNNSQTSQPARNCNQLLSAAGKC